MWRSALTERVGGKGGLDALAGLAPLGEQHAGVVDEHIATLTTVFEAVAHSR
jgi:hypothetical protein